MLSNFGRADGGRETWAYNFLPALLERYPRLRLNIYGLRVDGEPDNEATLVEALSPPDRPRISIDFVRASANRVPNALPFWSGLRRKVRQDSPGFVLGVGSFVELLAILLSPVLRRAPKILWLRSIFVDEKAHRIPPVARPLTRWVENAVLRRADLLIANGEDTAAQYRARGFDVTVIPNAIDLARWKMPPPRLEHPLRVAFIGRLAQVKGIDEFLEVARLEAQDQARFTFHIVGDGPAKAEVLRAQGKGLVRYHGPLPNESVPDFLRNMDVCVALTFAGSDLARGSGGAGVSNSLLEQMGAGRVLVCWDNPAFRQVLDDQSAYLVHQGDVVALREAFARIVDDPEGAASRARKAEALAQNYSLEAHMNLFAAAADRWLARR